MKLFWIILGMVYAISLYPAFKFWVVQRYKLDFRPLPAVLHFLSVWIIVPPFYIRQWILNRK